MDQNPFERIKFLGTVQGTSGGGGEVLGDTGADDGKLDKTKNFVKSRENGVVAERYTKGTHK